MTAHWMTLLCAPEELLQSTPKLPTCKLGLIDWSDGVYEPPLTCELTAAEVKKFVDEPMQVPPCHAQSIEMCVKQVTGVSGKVYTQEKGIRGHDESRRLMAKDDSKQD